MRKIIRLLPTKCYLEILENYGLPYLRQKYCEASHDLILVF